MNKFLVSTILLILFFQISFSQKPNLVFHQLTVSDGLSENTVRTILEDHKGYMWFGTEDGLNRYDGYKFKVYRNDNSDTYSISSRNIRYIYQDSKNRLWILTSNGLNIYDPIADVFYNFRNKKFKALESFALEAVGIIEDAKGNIWVATSGNGLFKIESLDKVPQRYPFPLDNDVNSQMTFLFQKSENELWVGARNELFKFDMVNCAFTDLSDHYGKGYEVRRITNDNDGNFWVCTTEGLIWISKFGDKKVYKHDPSNHNGISGNNVSEIVPFNNGNYLVGLDGGGFDYFDIKNQKFYNYKDVLSSNNVNCIYKDSKGDMWIGTFLNGINFSNSTTNLFILQKNNFYSDENIKQGIITSFLKDRNGNFWVGTDGGGLYKRNKGSTTFKHYKVGMKGLTSNVVIAMLEDTNGTIWMTTYGGGVCKYDPSKDTFFAYTESNSSDNRFFKNTKALANIFGKIWISGYGNGISVFDKKTEKFSYYFYDKNNPKSIPSDWVQCFYIDSKQDLWLGTFGGLCKYNPLTGDFLNYDFHNSKTKNHVEINTILDIYEDSRGDFWFGTMGNGLVRFDRSNGSYKAYTIEDGLSNNCVKSIIEDNQGNLWLSTNNGITKFNLLSKKIKPYTIKDGVPPCSFFFNSKYKDELGRIYFGANNGYLIIDPDMTGENKIIPPVVLTEFKVFNQPIFPGTKDSPLHASIDETKEITLPYSQNSISFEFAALNFNGSRNNKYTFFLEGFENNWNIIGNQRSATYTNLNPGTYTFKVKGSNNDNVWNEKGVSLKVVILPPYWKTWWFNTIIIIASLLFLYLFYYWRTRTFRYQNNLLEETVKRRTSELKEANEQMETLVYKASHDIKGPLKSIIGLTTIGRKDVSRGGNPLDYFDHILVSTSKLDNLVKELLEFTKVKQTAPESVKVNFKELVSEVLSSFNNFPGFERMQFHLDIKENGEFYSDRNMLTSIVQNLVENAIKYADFSKDENILSISIHVNEKGTAQLQFKDNGIGIPDSLSKRIFEMFFKANEKSNGAGLGLFIVKTTVEKLNGTIAVESMPAIGTTFHIKF